MEQYHLAPIKNYTKSEIAQLYDGISLKTLRRWLVRAGIYEQMKTDKTLTIVQVQLIFEKLGTPLIRQKKDR